MTPAPGEFPTDFDLLQQATGPYAGPNRRVLLWFVGLLAMLVASIVTLVLYLQNFEAEEDVRRRVASTQWLEQSVEFHFRRLEDDLRALGRGDRSLIQVDSSDGAEHAGMLWRERGVVLENGWLPADAAENYPPQLRRLREDANANPDNADALATMKDIARGLRRATYAGPMKLVDGSMGDVLWLAVPVFDRGEYAGTYLAALSINAALQSLVPAWFRSGHRLVVRDNLLITGLVKRGEGAYQAALNLPGTDMALQVSPLTNQPATVPRMFFAAALLFLLGMLASLYVLRRDSVKRLRVESLLKSQVALRTAMENSVTIGLRAWNKQGQILYVNQAFCRMVGFEARDLVGRSAPMPYWPTDQMDELQAIHRSAITLGTEQAGVEVRLQHRAGHLVDVLIHEAPLTAANGEQLGWMSSVLDISERKRAEREAVLQQERLEASGRLVVIGEVASTLAHELNQPLGAISSFSNGLLNRLQTDRITLEEVVPVVERLNRLSDKAGRIIQRVNAFARRREMSRHPLNLAEFVRATVGQRQISDGTALELYPGTDPVWVEADTLLLEHAVHNVVANAVHWASAGESPPRIRVDLLQENAMAGLVISDSGPGVTPEHQEQIFGAFYSAKEGGMGMGLAICRSVVEAHHGRIEVGRDPQLGGARFTLWLPLLKGQE